MCRVCGLVGLQAATGSSQRVVVSTASSCIRGNPVVPGGVVSSAGSYRQGPGSHVGNAEVIDSWSTSRSMVEVNGPTVSAKEGHCRTEWSPEVSGEHGGLV